jgi:hypothetical protein
MARRHGRYERQPTSPQAGMGDRLHIGFILRGRTTLPQTLTRDKRESPPDADVGVVINLARDRLSYGAVAQIKE